jgi:Kdo2-lipid IVA lauroyltransferase/acyltransferase
MKSDADLAAERIAAGPRLLFALARQLARLPYRWQMRVAHGCSWPLSWLAGKRRAIVAANIGLCFPELDARSQRQLVWRNLRSTAVSLFETSMTWFAPPAITRDIVEVSGLEHLQQALTAGKGALCLFSHFTMIELGGRLLSEALGQPMHQMVRRNNNASVEAVIDAARRRFCERTLEKKNLGDLLRSLREGHAVGYAPDQNFNLHMAFVPFFCQPAATLTMTSRIARLSRAPVLCCWIRRRPGGYGYQLRIDAPLAQFPGADPVADTARIMALLEAEVRKTPEQYLWAHRRFKTRPDGTALAYEPELLKPRHR